MSNTESADTLIISNCGMTRSSLSDEQPVNGRNWHPGCEEDTRGGVSLFCTQHRFLCKTRSIIASSNAIH